MRCLKPCIVLLTSILIVSYLIFILPFQAPAAEFHVTNGTELQAALLEAGENGEDDTVYLGAGLYFKWFPDPGIRTGGFSYGTTTQQALTLTGEFGTTAAGVILDGHNYNHVLTISDSNSYPTYSEIIVSGITCRNGNAPYDAGGLNIIAPNYNVTVRDCILIGNTGGGGHGGGLHISSDQTVFLENSIIMNNVVTESQFMNESEVWFDSQGGGAYIHRGDEVILRNNVIANNRADCNSCTSRGGGLFVGAACQCGEDVDVCTPNIHLIGNTVSENTADQAGGVYIDMYFETGMDWTANFYNNIIRNNTAGEYADLYVRDYSLLAHLRGFNNNYTEMYGVWTESGANVDLPPGFLTPGVDYHLLHDSEMIDQGTSSVPDPPGLPPFDAEGDPRLVGGAPDIGADEYVSEIMPDVKANWRDGSVELSRVEDLTVTVGLSNVGRRDRVDWWFAIQTPFGAWFLTPGGWTPDPTPFWQGSLYRLRPFTFPPIPLAGAHSGDAYTFYFGVDMEENGRLDVSSLYFDSVEVQITE